MKLVLSIILSVLGLLVQAQKSAIDGVWVIDKVQSGNRKFKADDSLKYFTKNAKKSLARYTNPTKDDTVREFSHIKGQYAKLRALFLILDNGQYKTVDMKHSHADSYDTVAGAFELKNNILVIKYVRKGQNAEWKVLKLNKNRLTLKLIAPVIPGVNLPKTILYYKRKKQ